jgi:solute carrier family 25 aspartate/glutamate transporter 12/13
MTPLPRVISTVHCDADGASSSLTGSALKSVRSVVATPESELKRWRRVFEANAKVIDGEKYIAFIPKHVQLFLTTRR